MIAVGADLGASMATPSRGCGNTLTGIARQHGAQNAGIIAGQSGGSQLCACVRGLEVLLRQLSQQTLRNADAFTRLGAYGTVWPDDNVSWLFAFEGVGVFGGVRRVVAG